MLEVTAVNILAVILTWWSCRARIKRPMLLPCLILALFYCVRYKYGNDYYSYTKIFNMINAHDNMDHYYMMRKIEVGWKLLNRLFRYVGFQGIVVVTTFFQFGTFGWFVTKYIPKKWQWFILFLYLVNPYFMFYQLSAMRQTVALCIMMWAMPYILKRKIWKAILLWLLAFSFHQSVFIAIPILFVGYLRSSMWKWTTLITVVLTVIAIAGPATLMSVVQGLTAAETFNKYAVYLSVDKGASLSSGFGFLFRLVVFGYLFILMRKTGRKMFIFGTLYQFSYIFSFLSLMGEYFTRLSYYYSFLGIPALLLFAIYWKRSLVDRFILIIYIFIEVMSYYQFFYHPTFTKYYLVYRTIFDVM